MKALMTNNSNLKMQNLFQNKNVNLSKGMPIEKGKHDSVCVKKQSKTTWWIIKQAQQMNSDIQDEIMLQQVIDMDVSNKT